MALCERCSRPLDRVVREPSFKSATDELLFIHAQVTRIDHEIKRLAAQRVLLHRRRNALAPSTVLLPYEIISAIFELVCRHVVPHNLLSPTMPLTLAAVCSQWRHIALSTPQLWSTASLSLYQSRNIPNAHALHAFFLRSAPCPLSLSLVFATTDDARDRLPADIPPSADVLRVFLAHSNQCRALKIDGLPPEWIPLLRQASNATPNLQQLWLCPYDNSREQQLVDMFSNAPHLRRVTLDNTFLSAITLPWSGLTHLKVSWVSIDECAEMLRRCPSLVECDFSRILSNAEFHLLPSSSPPIVLPSLRTLAWSYAGDAWEFQLFERILFPNLCVFKLKLRYDLMQFSMIVSVLRTMLRETSADVERLELDLGCPWVDLYEVLKDVRRVRVLRLVDEQDEPQQMVRKVMEALVIPPPRSSGEQVCFLPRLNVLAWRGHGWVDSTMVKWMVEKLKTRWEMCLGLTMRLERVVLDLTWSGSGGGGGGGGGSYQGGVDGERWVKDELSVLEKMGMEVMIVHHPPPHHHHQSHCYDGDEGGEAELRLGQGWLD